MADPLSVAGLVAGLVSLGIQATTGITSYLDAIRSRKDELSSAKRYVDSVRGNMQALENIQPLLQNRVSLPNSVESLLQSCRTEAVDLRNLINELSASKVLSPKALDKLEDKKKDITYVFRRPDIARLENRLSRFDSSLQSAIQLLSLEIQLSTVEKIDQIQSSSQAMLAVSHRMEAVVSSSNAKTTPLQQPMHAIPQITSLPAYYPHGQTQMRGVSHSNPVNYDLPLVDSIAQALSMVQGSRFDRLEEMVSRLLLDEQHRSQGMFYEGANLNHTGLFPQETRIVQRLSSYSNSLKRTADDLDPFLEPEAPQSFALVTTETCLCNTQRRRRRNRGRWGPIHLLMNVSQIEHHRPSCPFSSVVAGEQNRAYKLSCPSFPYLVHKIINASLSLETGAGGLKIGLALSSYNLVDMNMAPAFQLVNVLLRCAASRSDLMSCPLSIQDWEKLLDICFSHIFKLFQTGRASPRDYAYPPSPFSLAGFITVLFYKLGHWNDDRQLLQRATKLLRKVLGLGVESPLSFCCGYSNCSSLNLSTWAYAKHTWHKGWVAGIVQLLLRQNIDGYLAIANPRDLLSLLRSNNEMTDGYEIGVLGRAILQHDTRHVARLLKENPLTIEEKYAMDLTPFHLAVNSPECLRLLLRAANPSFLNQDEGDSGWTPLHWAMMLSPEACKNGLTELYTPCHGCNCAECAVLFLDAGCALPQVNNFELILGSASSRCKSAYAKHLQIRRQMLKRLALKNLTAEESDEVGLYRSSVLDSQALKVEDSLRRKGVPIDASLRVGRDGNKYITGSSIYHGIKHPSDAELFFQLGFRDLDDCDALGRRPLAEQTSNPRCIMWLLDHGADIQALTRVDTVIQDKKSRSRLIPAAVLISRSVWRNATYMPHEDDKSSETQEDMTANQSILSRVLEIEAADDCRCACSNHGCSAFLHVMKNVVHGKKPVSYLKAVFKRFLTYFGHLLSSNGVECAIRFLTFQASNLTHTCCELDRDTIVYRATCEEVVEIHDIESTDIQRFESIVAELTEDFRKAVTGMPIDKERLQEFFGDRWAKRVEQTFAVDNSDSIPFSAQKREAERLGVVWGPQKAEEEELVRNFDYWIGQMDRIMAGDEVYYW